MFKFFSKLTKRFLSLTIIFFVAVVVLATSASFLRSAIDDPNSNWRLAKMVLQKNKLVLESSSALADTKLDSQPVNSKLICPAYDSTSSKVLIQPRGPAPSVTFPSTVVLQDIFAARGASK